MPCHWFIYCVLLCQTIITVNGDLQLFFQFFHVFCICIVTSTVLVALELGSVYFILLFMRVLLLVPVQSTAWKTQITEVTCYVDPTLSCLRFCTVPL